MLAAPELAERDRLGEALADPATHADPELRPPDRHQVRYSSSWRWSATTARRITEADQR